MEILVFINLISLFFAFIVLLVASITDIKKREVPNWLSFSFLGIVIFLKLIGFIFTFDYVEFLLFPLICFLIFYALGNLMYYGQVFGGGDIKLLFGLSVAFSSSLIYQAFNQIFPFSFNQINSSFYLIFQNEPFIVSFMLNSLAMGGIYGVLYCLFLIVFSRKNQKIFYKEFYQKLKLKDKESKFIFYTFICLSIIFLILSLLDKLFLFFAISFLILPFLFFSVKIIEEKFMIKSVFPKNLSEGDWISQKFKVKNKFLVPNVHGLSMKELEFIKKNYSKKVKIKEGLPFVPVFLISLIISLIFGNLLIRFLYLFI